MASIWNDIELQWQGETFKIRPTIDFINHLEQRKGHTLPNLVLRLTEGTLGSGICCTIVADALTYAGATKLVDDKKVPVTAEDVFEEFSGVGRGVFDAAYVIVASCLPQPKEAVGVVKKKTPTKRKPAAKKT